MRFHFDPNLEYQNDAIQAVLRLFEGAERSESSFPLIADYGAVPNELPLVEEQVLENLQAVQCDEEIHTAPMIVSESLNSMDFSVEMETGTGKTYVYLRTAFELFEKYGMRKFIIVVPSVAIRQGVLKTFEMTAEHFAHLYDNVPYRFYEYDGNNLARVRHFAGSSDIEFMVMTVQSFDSESNIFNQQRDQLSGRSPLELVQKTRPVVILDEPQNMEGPARKSAIESLNSLFTLRYSATHRNTYNLVYRFSPVDAYNEGYVKQIEVTSVVEDHDANRAYVRCRKLNALKNDQSAKLDVWVRGDSGPEQKSRTFRCGDRLYDTTKLEAYKGWIVDRIDLRDGEITFRNGVVLKEGEERGPDHEAIARVQIRTTIERHMRKAELRRQRGIKVLSLFFIDEVKNYTDDDGYIRRCFVEEYDQLRQRDASWAAAYRERPADTVQGSYFSSYTRESKIETDESAYELIMNRKERLLSFDEPTEFIFSHSALREGWDNPNVFQICTLNRTVSTIRKRQEIGRGMRLAVDQQGRRIFDREVNTLTVVANQSYAEYVDQLQHEYREDLEDGEAPPEPKDGRKRRMVELNEDFELDADFQELWSKVARRAQYRVRVDSQQLIESAAQAVAQIDIPELNISVVTGKIEEISEEGTLDVHQVGAGQYQAERRVQHVPNLAAEIANRTDLTRRTIRLILEQAGNLSVALCGPFEFIDRAAAAINAVKRKFLVDGVHYLELDDAYEMSLFQNLESYHDNVVPIQRSIYDHVVCDSGVEKKFARDLDDMDEVRLFVKLPGWFTVTTPVGEYNPDWAIMFQVQDEFGESRDRVALVRETKGTRDPNERRGTENDKITCARRHFAAIDVDFDDITDAAELRDSVEQ